MLQKILSVLFLGVVLSLSVSCDDLQGEENVNEENAEDCSNVPCTLSYITLSVEVVDSENAPFVLDTFTVTDLGNGRELGPDFSVIPLERMQELGFYMYFSDFWLDTYTNETTTLRFSGIKNGMEVVSADLVVGADCCHVSLVSGETRLTVD